MVGEQVESGTGRALRASRPGLGLLLMGLLLACGGGGSGGDGASPSPVVASGVITGFSSVFVNGVRYEVEGGTVVAVEGESERRGDDSRLRIGMKVRVRANERAGQRVAERIEFDDDLKGPARNVNPEPADPSLGRFSVIGRTVIVDANTIFDDDIGNNDGEPGIDLRDLEPMLFPGNAPVVVSVSGFPTVDGLLATRIDRVNAAAGGIGRPDVDDDELELKGFVDSIASDGSAIVVSGTSFLVDEQTVFEDELPSGGDLVGRFVEVKADLLVGDELLAVRIESEDDFDDDDRRGELEIEGVLRSVDRTTDPDQIVIDGRTIEVRDASSLEGQVGHHIEIKGRFDDDGVLVIRQSKAEVENSVRIEDRVASVDRSAGRFTTRLGIIITPSGTSRLEDDASDDDEGDRLTPSEFLDRVDFDDYVEARGFPESDGSVRWTRIELDDDDDVDCRLRGPVESVSGDASSFEIVIRGVTIRTDDVDDDDFEANDDETVGRSGFFARLDVGDVVQAKSFEADSACQSGLLNAREIEFEPDDGLVGSVPPGQGDDGGPGNGGFAGNPFVGKPTDVTGTTFVLGDRTIEVVGTTRIDDSIIEAALGRELDGDDRRFDQVPDALSLPELLTGGFSIRAVVGDDGTALLIEDL